MTKAGKNEDNSEFGEGKMSAYMHLIPAPTPTRFVGKMAKVRENKKKTETGPLSRRSSIFPVNDVIEEAVEAIETKPSENKGNATLVVN